MVEPWGEWSACSASCNLGKRSRKMAVSVPPAGRGKACPINEQWQYCNPQACP